MEPRIQYAKTSDDVSLACYAIGEGPPLVVFPPLGHSHLQLEWQYSPLRAWYERLAKTRTVVRWDSRGMGLSSRSVTDFSEEALVGDMEAVASRLKLDSFSILTHSAGTPQAVAFAVRHPQQVSRLVVNHPWTNMVSPVLPDLAGQDWELFTETVALRTVGWSRGKEGRALSAFMRQCIDRETWQIMAEQVARFDVSERLGEVQAPTLVLSQPLTVAPIADPSGFAARIPNAQLVMLGGEPQVLWEIEEAFHIIDEFLREGESTTAIEAPLPSGTALILFLDIADSMALTSQLGDTAYRERERDLDAALRRAITEASGTPVEGKVLGDGVLSVFSSAREAINAAVRCRDLGNEAGLPLHLGIHAGDVTREGNNVHGGAVQVASRVQGVAATGEILVSQTVRDLARTSAGVAFEDRGEFELKGIGEPQRLFAVRERA